jgi:hypothetical protein
MQLLSPTIKGVSDPSIPSVPVTFSETQAPGVLRQPTFLQPEVFVRLFTPDGSSPTWQEHKLQLSYRNVHDLDTGQYTFDRVSAAASGRYELRRDLTDPFDRNFFQNLICEPIAGDRCRFGWINLRATFDGSHARGSGGVPFYYQPTLGGTDFYGLDTLRGFDDYRFRAANRLLLQAELDKPVWGPLGILGFYDLGKVAQHASDLDLAHTHHDLGVGVFVRAGGKIVLRAYMGFGGGEGSHLNVKGPSVF